jgi:23S rRNA (guanosine2251-2'-O)-methyltransferase
MPYLTNRDSIIETLREHRDKVTKLWIEAGHERRSHDIIEEARKAGISVRVIPGDQFQRKFKHLKSHACLESTEFTYFDPDELLAAATGLSNPLFSAFDGVYDPQNLGNIIRTAACLHLDGLVLPRDRACAVTDTVMNVARGGTEHIRIARVTNLPRYMEELKAKNMFCFGLDELADKTIFEMDLDMPLCLVLGGEEGLRRLTRERCDGLLRIPTSKEFPSLNVANAFAIAAYEAIRQRVRRVNATG